MVRSEYCVYKNSTHSQTWWGTLFKGDLMHKILHAQALYVLKDGGNKGRRTKKRLTGIKE